MTAVSSPPGVGSAGGWRDFLAPYRDWRMAKILLLGFISGFPWLLIGSMLSLWLKEEGLSRGSIGLFGALGVVYAINVFWAPLIDGLRLPFLSRTFGNRRAWILAMQLVIAAAMITVSFVPSATDALYLVAICMLVMATASATQDIAIDATRISLIRKDEPEKVGPGAAMSISGWWLGFGGGKALALPMVELLQGMGVEQAWQAGYLSLVLVLCLSALLLLLFVPEPEVERDAPSPAAAPPKEVFEAALLRAKNLYVRPVAAFVSQYTLKLGLLLLAFIFFFKTGEAFLGRMSIIFYKEIGFSASEIGLLSGGLGTITVCAFAILGSAINARYGLFRGVLLGGLAMASTNLLFALLAFYPERWLFGFAVVADQFTTSISTVAFVAFLSQLCVRRHAATQYAALASLGNLSRTTLAAGSGYLIDGLGGNWPMFFVITILMVAPSLLILLANHQQLRPIMRGEPAPALRAASQND